MRIVLKQSKGTGTIIGRDESGYSMVEVMVAILILAIAIIPMVGMFDAGLRAAVVGSNYDQARALANSRLEKVEAMSYPNVVASYPPANGPSGAGSQSCPSPTPSGFDCRIQTNYISVDYSTNPPALKTDSSARTMMQVEVTVTWNGNANSYTTTGLKVK